MGGSWHVWRTRIIVGFFAVFGVACALKAADIANPPDLARYRRLSPEVVDRRGVLLRPFLSGDGYWRLKTGVADVSPRYLALLKAYEDQRFDDHGGVDPLALARAATQFVRAGHIVSGGSTLTMQAARLLEPRPRGFVTKLFQMARALQLEERYSKDEILSIYLTLAPFGGNVEGVRAASLAWFGKSPRALDLSEAAMLVALPQSPAKQRPDRHAIGAKRGRDKVLSRMVAEGILGPADAALAEREGTASIRRTMPLEAPHFSARLASTAGPGVSIRSTIDAGLQSAIERLALREKSYLADRSSLAIVVVKNAKCDVLAYVGGVDYWGASGQVDLAARPRSPGSALKPFIYGLAFDDLILHPATMLEDAPTNFGDYAPRDFSGSFQGAVTARDALQMSLNVPAVMVLDRIGPLRFSQMLENAGAHLAYPSRDSAPSLPIALGGLGISLRDITMLYAAIPNGGEVRPLRVLADAPEERGHPIFGAVAAWYLRDILSGVALPDGWAMGQGLARTHAVAFKTGTSYGFRDAWAVGFSGDYTVGVWVGRADGAPSADRIGREAAAPILLQTFELLPPDRALPARPPAGALLVRSTEELPPGLRVFVRDSEPEAAKPAIVPPPSIAFPPDGATVPVPPPNAKDRSVLFRAEGGRAPFTWLVNGEILGSFDRFTPVPYQPTGEGFARVTVVDAEGRSDTARIRFKRLF
jgi:penicillin-binding protein 1C